MSCLFNSVSSLQALKQQLKDLYCTEKTAVISRQNQEQFQREYNNWQFLCLIRTITHIHERFFYIYIGHVGC